ncbi:MAG TPA: PilN domain-containing protein [Gaiellaceae bacterium]|jgi:Tfp pilus assembly protein PilN
MRAVNLLPYQPGNDEKLGIDLSVVIGVVITVVIAVVLAGGYFLEKGHAASERQRLALVQAELAQAKSQQPSTPSASTAQLQVPVVLSQQAPWHVALDAALATRVSWDVFLQQLEYVVPDKVSLTTVSVGGAGATAGGTVGTITLGGYAFSSDDVGVFLATLARVPHVSDVTLVSSTANSGSSIQTFQVTAEMALPAALTVPPPATDTTTTTSGG